MTPTIYWADTPAKGKIGLSARPRGGDWLEDEVTSWRLNKIAMVLSLLIPAEEKELDLTTEAELVRAAGMAFVSVPISDMEVPTSQYKVHAALEQMSKNLSAGKNVLIHCRQGIGRTGMLAAALLITAGVDASTALERISAARGVPVPETYEQRRWVERYAETLAAAK